MRDTICHVWVVSVLRASDKKSLGEYTFVSEQSAKIFARGCLQNFHFVHMFPLALMADAEQAFNMLKSF